MSTTVPQKYRQCKQNGSLNYTTETYSYNPFTGNLPSTTAHWKYIKYKPKNDSIQSSFEFVKPTDAVDDNIWVLYGGSGGYGGSITGSDQGGAGGGGTGELKMSLLDKTKFTNINCTIGKLNNQYSLDYDSNANAPNGTSRNYNYNTTSATTLAIKNTTTTTDTLIDTLKATGGFCGQWVNSRVAGEGGHGANVVVYNGSNLVTNPTNQTYNISSNNYLNFTTTTTITKVNTGGLVIPGTTTTTTSTTTTATTSTTTTTTIFRLYAYTTTTITTDITVLTAIPLTTPTIPFGSLGGGSGIANMSNAGANGGSKTMGDRYELIPQTNSTTVFNYRYVDYTVNYRTPAQYPMFSGVSARFDISLSGVPCDGTGTATILRPGDGGNAKASGNSAEGGFIMFFYKTTNPLTRNNNTIIKKSVPISSGVTQYNYNPLTGKIPGQIDDDDDNPGKNWIYYKYEKYALELLTSQYMPSSFYVESKYIVGDYCWALVGGQGGAGGNPDDNSDGSGGGGGGGEVVLAKINKYAMSYVFRGNDATTELWYGNSSTRLVTAYGGDDGRRSSNKNGGGGGNGGGYQNGATFDISEDHSDDYSYRYAYTYRFGSGKGGAGEANGAGKTTGICGKYMTPSLKSGSTKEYDYKLLGADNDRTKTGSGVTVDFGISLGSTTNLTQCDNTGLAYNISRGGNGGKTDNGNSRSGDDGAPKFVMFFYETTDSGALK